MVGNKKRLYVAVYPSGTGQGTGRKFHWALLVGPKIEQDNVNGTRYHATNKRVLGQPVGTWRMETNQLEDVRTTNQLLARLLVAKIEDEGELIKLLERVPVDPPGWEVRSGQKWTCKIWVRAALELIVANGKVVGTNILGDFEAIEKTAHWVVEEKLRERRYDPIGAITQPKPTYCMLTKKWLID